MKNKEFSIVYSYEYIACGHKMSKSLKNDIKYFIDETSKIAGNEIFDTLKEMYAGVELDSTLYKLLYKIVGKSYIPINEDTDLDFYIYPDNVSVYHVIDGDIYLSNADENLGDYSDVYTRANVNAIDNIFESMDEIDGYDSDNVDLIFINNLIMEKGAPIAVYKPYKK